MTISQFKSKHKFLSSQKFKIKCFKQNHKSVDNAYCPCHSFSLISINNNYNSSKNYSKKQCEVETTAKNFIDYFTRNHVGFFTLTFNTFTDFDTAMKTWNSFKTNVFSKRYKYWMYTVEAHKSGAVHMHFLIYTDFDMKPEAFPWEEVSKGNFKNVDKRIREEWQWWNSITGFKVVNGKRVVKNKYNIGRTELRPLKGDSMQAAGYIGKYVSKSLSDKASSKFVIPADSQRKRFRTVGYSKSVLDSGLRTVVKDFSWFGCAGRTSKQWYRKDFRTGELLGGVKYRKRCSELALHLKDLGLITIATPTGMQIDWNKRWAWQFRGLILGKGSVSSDFVIDQLERSLKDLNTENIDDCVFNLTKLLRWGGVSEEKIEEYEDRYLNYEKFLENERIEHEKFIEIELQERIKLGKEWYRQHIEDYGPPEEWDWGCCVAS